MYGIQEKQCTWVKGGKINILLRGVCEGWGRHQGSNARVGSFSW